MPVQESGAAPYAPTHAVTGPLDAYRETGLAINAANLGKLGITESILPRTLQAFKLLNLLDAEGNPTQALIDFKQASSETYRDRLAETLRAAYAPIFAVTGADPSQKTTTQLVDAFRTYTPDTLRPRMVRLFLGLCAYSGIIAEAPKTKSGPKTGRVTTSKSKATDPAPKAPDRSNENGAGLADPMRKAYFDLLVEKARADNADDKLLDRIERLLNLPEN